VSGYGKKVGRQLCGAALVEMEMMTTSETRQMTAKSVLEPGPYVLVGGDFVAGQSESA
jgi:hypothetical protein